MTEALGQSGYQVRHCGVGDGTGQEATGSRIRAAVIRACAEVPPGGVLILYFSGHGVTIDGQSYLVPCDVYPEPGGQRPDRDSLVPVMPRYLEHCKARLAIFFVDACREDPAAPMAVQPQGGVLPYPAGGEFALVNSCRPGQRSRYADTGSFFSQALAEALDRRSPARTLDEVYTEVERQMARKAARTEGMEQVPEIVWARHGSGSRARGDVVICEGDQITEAWRRAVTDSSLWDRCPSNAHRRDRIRTVAAGVVDEFARRWGDAQSVLLSRAGVKDPWSAHDYPTRVLTAIDACLAPDVELTPDEVGILVAVPFMREATLAEGLREAAAIAPTDFSRTYRDGPRADLEITHAMHEHVCRRAEGLARRNQHEARDALAMWLVHRWLSARPRLWDSDAAALVCRRLAAAVASGPASTMTERELCSLLRVLMHSLGADADDRRLIERLGKTDFDPRTRGLAALLWLAGIIAADPRRMPTVVVDHVGIGAELQLSALLAATARLDWRRSTGALNLHAVCDHPALHDAFTDVANRAELAGRTVRERLVLDPELAKGLPTRFTASGLRPEHHDGVPAYETPLLRFRLSDEKVRELLMGRQLYGDPMLAIRELYQNALDACRYRHVRRCYRERINCQVTPWAGLITFDQGVDTDGREFVECTDNGVGMSVEALKNTFANAGERFVYRQGFRYEQAHWQDLDPPLRLVPNSQFGVGVFSYFMIADEIQIVTRPVDEYDVPGSQAHSVRIASSGSLFQITSTTELPGGGTRVRLYLTGEDRLSVLRTMRRLLWLAEFRVEVQEPGTGHETWQPETLRYPDATTPPLKCGDDLWWVSGEGGLAADGIRTNEETHGFVVNLRDTRRPQFTVDRNKLRRWDKQWVRGQILDSLPSLTQWSGLTLSWLWQVARSTPAVAQDIFTHLVSEDRTLPVEGPWGHGISLPIRQVGCLPVDLDLVVRGMGRIYGQSKMWIIAWRTGVWGGAAPSLGSDQIASAVRIDGFPTVDPFDADVLTDLYETGGYRNPSQYGRPPVDTLLEIAAHEDHPVAERLRRLRRYAITGLDLTANRAIPQLNHTFEPDDQPLLLALAAWAPPGEPPRSAVGGWLARASVELNAPLDEVLQRVAQIVPDGWSPPAGDLTALRDHMFNRAELDLFSQHVTGRAPWIGSEVSPAHVVKVSTSLGRPVNDVLTLFEKFAPLGHCITKRDRYPNDLTPLEREALRYVDVVGQRFTLLHVFALAGRTATSTHDAYRGLARLAETGMLRLPDFDTITDLTPTDTERAFVNDDLYRYNGSVTRYTLDTGWQAIRWLVREIRSRDFAGFEKRLEQFRRLLDLADPRRPVTVPELVDLAYYLDCSISEAVKYLETILPDTTDRSALPSGTLTSPATCHRLEERTALIGTWTQTNDPDVALAWRISPGSIVAGAVAARQSVGDFLARLEPYRALGAPLPQLDEATQQTYRDITPDRYDRDMMVTIDDQGAEHFIDRVSPLRLVQTAGRFGWTLAGTHQRMARLVPLGLTLDYPVDAVPDGIVHWQDLLVITRYLDGQEPTLSGRVGPAHVATAAEEVGEPVDQIRERLRRFAPLIGYQLDEEPQVVD
ncbi:hypothetical protein GCM10027290_48450 [Micromonospora sonneratiae]